MLFGIACSERSRAQELGTRAEVAYAAGRIVEARSLAAELVAVAERSTPTRADALWTARLLAAEIEIEADEMPTLKAVHAALLAEEAEGLGPLVAARRCKVLAHLALKMNEMGGAKTALDEARSLLAEVTNSEGLGLGLEVDLLGGSWLVMQGRWEQADRLLEETLGRPEVAKEARLGALLLNQLGFSHIQRARYDRALVFLDLALVQARRAGAETVLARVQLNRGICKGFLGHFAAARTWLAESAAIYRRLQLPSPLRLPTGSLGNVAWLEQDYAQATSHYIEALQLSRRYAPGTIALWAGNLANAYVYLEDWARADEANRQARQALSPGQHEAELRLRLNEASIARGRGELARAEALAREILATERVPRSTRFASSAELAQTLARRGELRQADAAFTRALDEVDAARAEVAGVWDKVAFFARLLRFHQVYVDWLVEIGRSEDALFAAERAKARALTERLGALQGPTPRPDAWRKLAEGEVRVAYWVGRRRSFAWRIDAAGIRRADLPGAEALTALAQAFRTSVESGLRDLRSLPTSPALTLWQAILAPVMTAGGEVRLVVSPDGPLHAVPFAALVQHGPGGSADARRYLIESTELSVTPSLAALPRQAEARRLDVLAFGDPEPHDRDFPRLPDAARELDAIRDRLGGRRVTIVRGEAARPEAFLRAPLDRYNGLHFAAHAIDNPLEPLEAAIILSRGALGSRLTVRDVIGLTLDLDLVTLSACRSAGGRIYSGEGLMGLAWGFLAAGARTVVAGAWDVADGATAALMSEFYAALGRGEPPPRALRSAQLSFFAASAPVRWQTPYHWAAFAAFVGPGPRAAASSEKTHAGL